MDYEIVDLPAFTVEGYAIRTANDSPSCTTDIGMLWKRFSDAGTEQSIPFAIRSPYACFALYYNYDPRGNEYDTLIGCETSQEETSLQEHTICKVPAGRYAKLAIRGGDCVTSVAKAWNALWSDEELTSMRSFTVDFEAYYPGDDMSNANIDIFVAIKWQR